MRPKRYRKKPVEIEAMRFTNENVYAVTKWCGGTAFTLEDEDEHWIMIPTLEGELRASVGDYVIRGVAGEFYACKPYIFEATYDAVS